MERHLPSVDLGTAQQRMLPPGPARGSPLLRSPDGSLWAPEVDGVIEMGKTPRKYKGARTPQSLKEVRASARRGAVQQPKRTEAKSRVTSAVAILTGKKTGDATAAVSAAASALDRAAKSGAIHKNAAARRKSRLAKKAAAAKASPTGTTTAIVVKKAKKKAAISGAKRAAATKAAAAKAVEAKALAAKPAAKKPAAKKAPAKKSAKSE